VFFPQAIESGPYPAIRRLCVGQSDKTRHLGQRDSPAEAKLEQQAFGSVQFS
jgi:hypothetical protein